MACRFPFAPGERSTLKRVRQDCDVARTLGRVAMASRSNSKLQLFRVNLSRSSYPQTIHSPQFSDVSNIDQYVGDLTCENSPSPYRIGIQRETTCNIAGPKPYSPAGSRFICRRSCPARVKSWGQQP